MTKTSHTLMFSALLPLLSSCDGSTPEDRQARRITACQEMINTTHPMPTDHLPLTERGEEVEFNAKWERCRAMIEDRFLEGEKERLPEYDKSVYLPLKMGGRFYIGPKKYSATDGMSVPYTWKHSYIEYDIETREEYAAAPDSRSGVYFGMHSVNNLAYQHAVSRAPSYEVACDNIVSKPVDDVKATFTWNGILFGALTRIEHKGDNQIKWQKEWQRICPIAVEVVKEFKEVELQPIAMKQE